MGLLYTVCARRLHSCHGAFYCGVQQRPGQLQGGTGWQLHAVYAVFIRQDGDPTLPRGERVGSQEELRAVRRDGRKCGKLQFSILDTTSQQRGSLLPDTPFIGARCHDVTITISDNNVTLCTVNLLIQSSVECGTQEVRASGQMAVVPASEGSPESSRRADQDRGRRPSPLLGRAPLRSHQAGYRRELDLTDVVRRREDAGVGFTAPACELSGRAVRAGWRGNPQDERRPGAECTAELHVTAMV